jgi:hypothetical protein
MVAADHLYRQASITAPTTRAQIVDRRWDGHLHKIANVGRAAAMVAVSTPGWAELVVVSRGFFEREVSQSFQVAALPCCGQIPGELARIHLNLDDSVPQARIFKLTLCKELEPFIIGIGEIACREIPEGVVICRVNNR